MLFIAHRCQVTRTLRPLLLFSSRLTTFTLASYTNVAMSSSKEDRKTVHIDVISDTVCPWCFLGKKRLEKAMSKLQDKAEFEVNWLPFQLNSGAPQEGVNKLQMYNEKFGQERVAQMVPQMTKLFAEEGYTYNLGGLTGNTFDSHRLIEYAGKFGTEKQNALVEELMKAYFTQEKYINDRQVLVEAAEKVGVPGAVEYLANPNNGREDVIQKLRVSTALGISGVPAFIINNKYSVSGAQSPEVFERVLNTAIADTA